MTAREAGRRHMKLLLLMPGGQPHKLQVGPWARSFREAPLTLTTLAALVPPELNASLRLVDASIEPVPLREPFDLVAISCMTGTSARAYALADHFRAQGITVVLGGVHVTLRPEEARRHADAIVRGFAERTWPQLLRDFTAGQLQPEYFAEHADLAGLPDPRRDLQHAWAYMVPNTVFATRGCRSSCDFCSVPAAGFGWHTRPVPEVINEIPPPPGAAVRVQRRQPERGPRLRARTVHRADSSEEVVGRPGHDADCRRRGTARPDDRQRMPVPVAGVRIGRAGESRPDGQAVQSGRELRACRRRTAQARHHHPGLLHLRPRRGHA